MAKIIRGYWDCEYCESKGIDGLADKCPFCGAGKSEHVKYYTKADKNGKTDEKDVLSEAQLEAAGIGADECDGKHKEWVCTHCQQLNNWRDTVCVSCGSNKEDATKQYLGESINGTPPPKKESKTAKVSSVPKSEPKEKSFIEKITSWASEHKVLSAVIGIVMVLMFLLAPVTEDATITDMGWESTISIEEIKEVDHDGWSLPSDAKLKYTRQEVRSYKKVLDHYEKVSVEKSRRVQDGYDTERVDNGNGTFTEKKVPRYKTEYYTETKEEPVYRDEPVYDTKYYYTQLEWVEVYQKQTSGKDKSPYWATDYTLKSDQRDTKRWTTYHVTYDDELTSDVDQDTYMGMEVGQSYGVTKNRLGMVYSQERNE